MNERKRGQIAPFFVPANSAALTPGAVIEIVAQGKGHDSQQGIGAFLPAMVQGHRARHDAKAKRPDRGRHHESVLHRPMAKRDRAQHDREHKPNLVKQRIFKDAACGSEETKQDRRADAVSSAQARQRDCGVVKAAIQ